MKKITLTMLMLAFCVLTLSAREVSVSEAQSIAQQFLKSNAPRRVSGMPSQSRTLTLAYTDAGTNYYVFNCGVADGFIVVSGDDRAMSVLGYTDEGSFDLATMPENARQWLDVLAGEIAFLKQHPDLAPAQQAGGNGRSVSPIVKAKWNQEDPYNLQCPTVNGSRTVTGCVATATAQAMSVFQHPTRGTGSHSYTTQTHGISQSVTFSSSTYQWAQMTDTYDENSTTSAKNAVAKLMHDVGVSIDMDYSSISSASTKCVPAALATFFGYDKGVRLVNRPGYTITQWKDMIINELDNGRPIIYSGDASNGGHSFILDGYNLDGLFHFNWGWGGSSNGYYLITALNPAVQGVGSFDGGYNTNQDMVIGIRPNAGGSATYTGSVRKLTTPNSTSCSKGSSIAIQYYYFAISSSNYGNLSGNVGYRIVNSSGSTVSSQYSCGTFNSCMQGYYYAIDGTLSVPSSISAGTYTVIPTYTIAGSTRDLECGADGYLKMTVSGSTATFSQGAANYSLSSSNLQATGPFYRNQPFRASVTLRNNGTTEYNDKVCFGLANSTSVLKYFEQVLVAIPPGASVDLDAELTSTLVRGTYTLGVYDCNRNLIGSGISVQFTNNPESPALVIDQNLKAKSYYMPGDQICASAVIKNNGGTFTGSIELVITPETDDYIKNVYKSDFIVLNKNESATLQFTNLDFAGAEDTEYHMWLTNPSNTSSWERWGEAAPFRIGVMPYEEISLGDMLANGVEGNVYVISNDMVIADYETQSDDGSLFVCDSEDNWIRLVGIDHFDNIDDGIKGGTLRGTFSRVNGNPQFADFETEPKEIEDYFDPEIELFDLYDHFDPAPSQVIDIAGYYYPEDGVPVLRAFGGGNVHGKSVTLAGDWFEGTLSLNVGTKYIMRGVVQLKQAWSAAPRLIAADDDLYFQNYVVYPLSRPVTTAVRDVNATKTVKAVRYISITGQQSDKPFSGVNIVETSYTDGTTSTAKALFR